MTDMKLTQICFERITADGRKWAAVMSYDGGIPKMHSLHRKGEPLRATLDRSAGMNARVAGSRSRLIQPFLADRPGAVPA
jgi:hypothetical protein